MPDVYYECEQGLFYLKYLIEPYYETLKTRYLQRSRSSIILLECEFAQIRLNHDKAITRQVSLKLT